MLKERVGGGGRVGGKCADTDGKVGTNGHGPSKYWTKHNTKSMETHTTNIKARAWHACGQYQSKTKGHNYPPSLPPSLPYLGPLAGLAAVLHVPGVALVRGVVVVMPTRVDE